MYTLRPYQKEAAYKAIEHFQKSNDPALIVLPTGAGKSLVIATLAQIARGRVLVLAHVKELVSQNHEKYESYGLEAGIFSSGLKRKDKDSKVIFGSIQSVVQAQDDFFENFSLVIIDECHRVGKNIDSQYQQVISKLRKGSRKENKINVFNEICILGLTATPYRLDLGYIYNYHYHGMMRTGEERFFKKCIFELSLRFMIKNFYLTPPLKIDAPVACYDFSSLSLQKNGRFSSDEIKSTLESQERATPGIVAHIVDEAKDRNGVMVFTSTISHAYEVLSLLPLSDSAIITGEIENTKRDEIIIKFKNKRIKFLVNVSVLTTGFDVNHVDLIAILRPTESVALYQQIIGRGLRLSEGKKNCLVLDYTGLNHDLFYPMITDKRPALDTSPVEVLCPICEYKNIFWGKIDEAGTILEHYGRKCQFVFFNEKNLEYTPCGYRFRFKECEKCGEENDITSRHCKKCAFELIDPDKKLKEAMELKDAHVLKVDSMYFYKQKESLEIRYYDVDGEYLSEIFKLNTESERGIFYHQFIRKHLKNPVNSLYIDSTDNALKLFPLFRNPEFVIGHKNKYFWSIREKVFFD